MGNGANNQSSNDAASNVVIGHDSVCDNTSASTPGVAIGFEADTKANGVSIGAESKTGTQGVCIGRIHSGFSGSGDANKAGVAIGHDSGNHTTQATSVGYFTRTFADNCTSIGARAYAGGGASMSVGSNNYNTAVGAYSNAWYGPYSTAIGAYSCTTDVEQVVLGRNARGSQARPKGTSNDAVVFGYNLGDIGSISTAGQIKAKGGLVLDSQTSSNASAVIGTGSDPNLMTLSDNTVTVSGTVSATTLNTSGNATVTGIFITNGSTVLNGGLDVEGSKLTVANGTGAVGIAGALTVTGTVDIDNTVDISETVTCSKSSGTGLAVTKNATIGGDLSVGGNTIVTGNLTVQGTTTQISSSQVTLTDPVFVVAKDNTTATQPRGIQMEYDKDGSANSGHAALLLSLIHI